MGGKLSKIIRLAATALAVCTAAPAGADDSRPLSPAQIALFESNHLKEINHPVVLDYRFRHRGGPEGDYEDKVSADIRTVHQDGRKDVWIEFLSGDRRVNFPPAMGFNGNPLLMFFLEHDAMEMRAVTGGAAQYFRTRIREAFVDGAAMHPVDVAIDGAPRHATEIEVTPFSHDPNLARFPAFAGKTYHFILSDAVPGSLYEISTTAQGAAPDTFEEAMTYAGEHEETH
ncbi:MAG: hypothetical protein ACLQJR_10595 [Stellaceae bacterium]